MNDYRALLESTEQHLQALKSQGVQHIAISGETLEALGRPVSIRVQAAVVTQAAAPTQTVVSNPTVKTAQVAASGPAVNAAPIVTREAVLPTQTKEEAIRDLRERALACVKCPHLVKSRKNVVFGVGNINAELMFVGEAPGADEDAQGEPFVGAAGELLTKIIKTMGFSRETVYIANVLKCRPDTPGQSYGNRKPTPDEMKTCLPFLLAQIEVIRPKVMVALGATAIEGLLGRAEPVGKLRGKFLEFREIPLMPTFHPAYLARNQALSEKRKVWEDMLQVMEKLGTAISEKQRGYFLPALTGASA